MKLLAFETATEACSVALYLDGEIIGRHEVAPRLHAEYALPWAEQLLDEAGITRSQLDELVVTDTIPLSAAARACGRIRQLSVAELLAETIRRVAFGESVSSLYVD